MKKIFLIISLLFPTMLLCQTIESLTVYYVPWELNIEGEMTENLIKSFPKYSKSKEINSKDAVYEFISSLNILHLRPLCVREKKKFIPKMVIELKVCYSNSSEEFYTEKVYLNSDQLLKYKDSIYRKNIVLERWLYKYVFPSE